MARGGKRSGAGRKPGSANKRTREVANKAAATGKTPLEYLLSVMCDSARDEKDRLEAAKAAAPYVHPKLASVEHKGEGGGPLKASIEIRFV